MCSVRVGKANSTPMDGVARGRYLSPVRGDHFTNELVELFQREPAPSRPDIETRARSPDVIERVLSQRNQNVGCNGFQCCREINPEPGSIVVGRLERKPSQAYFFRLAQSPTNVVLPKPAGADNNTIPPGVARSKHSRRRGRSR